MRKLDLLEVLLIKEIKNLYSRSYRIVNLDGKEVGGSIFLKQGKIYCFEMENTSTTKYEFRATISKKDMAGDRLVGFWHTHVRSFLPSPQDLLQSIILNLKYKRNFLYVIIYKGIAIVTKYYFFIFPSIKIYKVNSNVNLLPKHKKIYTKYFLLIKKEIQGEIYIGEMHFRKRYFSRELLKRHELYWDLYKIVNLANHIELNFDAYKVDALFSIADRYLDKSKYSVNINKSKNFLKFTKYNIFLQQNHPIIYFIVSKLRFSRVNYSDESIWYNYRVVIKNISK